MRTTKFPDSGCFLGARLAAFPNPACFEMPPAGSAIQLATARCAEASADSSAHTARFAESAACVRKIPGIHTRRGPAKFAHRQTRGSSGETLRDRAQCALQATPGTPPAIAGAIPEASLPWRQTAAKQYRTAARL